MNHIQIAITQIGKEEIPRGSNAGEDVEKYLHSVGLGKGYSWCMAFVYWCVSQEKPNSGLVKTAGVLDQWYKIDNKYKHSTPAPGDIFIQYHGHGQGHTGFVESVDGNNIHTIEGNTNDEGSREGYEVCRRTRATGSCIGFIRI